MTVPVRGDFSKLADLRRRLERLPVEFRPAVSKACAEEAVRVLDDEFRSSSGPDGQPWTPLVSRVGKPLLDTGAHLRNTLTPKVTPTGFIISTPFPGAAVHQDGATITAKNARMLRFRMGGARPRGYGKGQTGGWVSKQSVTIPARPYMPDPENPGPRCGGGIQHAASAVMRRCLASLVSATV